MKVTVEKTPDETLYAIETGLRYDKKGSVGITWDEPPRILGVFPRIEDAEKIAISLMKDYLTVVELTRKHETEFNVEPTIIIF